MNIRKIVTIIIVIIAIIAIIKINADPNSGIGGENIKVKTSTDYSVYFNPVCPECTHISEVYSVNLSDGEEHSTVHVCEKCFNVYDISIKR